VRRPSYLAPHHAALAALLATSCRGTEPSANGSYSAAVTGAVNGTFSGTAAFVVNATELGISMTPRGDGWVLGLFAFPRERPKAGATFEIVAVAAEQQPVTPHAYVRASEFSEGASRSWTSTGGELRITASSADRLAGTFRFTAQSSGAGSIPGEVTVAGSFDAVCRVVLVTSC
jgi:hypothetical protein